MNTRIRELARQADDGYTGNNGDDMGHALVGEDAIEKFAELIVRECMNTIATSNESRQTAYYYRNIVAEHFGVIE